MKDSSSKIVLSVLLSILSFGILCSQNYADKEFYLVDSLILESIDKPDKDLIDSLLSLYHKSTKDSTKLGLISKITEDCLDDNVWPKYNQLLFNESQEKLSYPDLSKKEKIFIKKAMASAINNKGYILYNLGYYEKAIKQYQFSFNLYQEIHDKNGLATCLNNIGSIYDDQGDTEKALEYYLRSLNFVEQIGDQEGIALALNNIGYIYSDKGQIGKALEYYSRSIKILEKSGDNQVLATTYNNVGYIYKMQGDNKKALEYYFKCLKIFEEIGFVEGIAGSYNNIGQIYAKKKSTSTLALEYYEKSLKIQKNLGHKKGEAETSNNIGVLYEDRGELEKAHLYYSSSLKIREEIGDVLGHAHSLASVANIMLLKGNVKGAKKNAEKSLDIGWNLGFPNIIRAASYVMSNIYAKENDPVNELKMYKLFIKMSDSIVNTATKEASIKHDIQYQFEKQAFADSLTRAESQKIKDLKYNQEIDKQKTYTFIGVIGFILMIIVVIVVLRGYQLKRKTNLVLAEKNSEIKEKNLEITDSITYAKRIQKAIIPSQEELNLLLKNAFVFYKPKDIVAGDFYWLQKVGDEILYAAADCTGHGVPGAMVSVVCHNALNRSVREYNLKSPADILDKTRELVIETFQRSSDITDGMDIALCSINYKKKTLEYSGANNSLYIIREGKLIEIKANKQPVGKHYRQNPFTNHKINLKENDSIYTFSDGFADQFGGVKGKKFMVKRLRNLLISISDKAISDQKGILFKEFNDWKGQLEQVDDVCIIGLKV